MSLTAWGQMIEGTPIVWADTTDFTGTISGYTRTLQIDLTSLADTAARQGAKANLAAQRSSIFKVRWCIELNVAVATSGLISSLFFSGSNSATAGNDNQGGASGADAAYTGTAGDSIANSLKQCKIASILSHTTDADTILQIGEGFLQNLMQYVSPIVFDESGQAYEGDAVEMYIALIPMIPVSDNAAVTT